MTPNRFLYLAGVAAPLVFLLSVVVGGAFRDGYSHLSDPVSVLGMQGAAGAGAVNAAWTATGLLILLFGLALWRDRQGPGRIVAVAVMVAGAASAAISIGFPMDPPGVPMSGAQLGHNSLVGVAALAFATALLSAALSARMPRVYRSLSGLALLAMIAGGAGAALSQSLDWGLIGAFERLTQAGYHCWLMMTAAEGLRRR